MHSKYDNIEITINDETDEVIKELFKSLKCRYQKKKYILLMFQNITQIVKNNLFFYGFQTKKSYGIILQ